MLVPPVGIAGIMDVLVSPSAINDSVKSFAELIPMLSTESSVSPLLSDISLLELEVLTPGSV